MVDGKRFYQVDPRRQLKGNSIGGKREAFASKKKAIARADEIYSETLLDGNLATQMDAELRLMALKASASLEPFGKSIADAVEFYRTHLLLQKAKEESQTISALVDLWWKEKFNKKRKNLRRATIDDLKETGKTLKKTFGDKRILDITTKDFEAYLFDLDIGERRRYNLRSRFSQFFNWCINSLEIPIKNPLAPIEIEVPDKEVAILTPCEAKKVMHLCQESYPELTAYCALSLFGGLRPTEAELLEWSNIYMEERQIKILGQISKRKEGRVFTMHDTLLSWLKSIQGAKSGRILQTSSNRGTLERLRADLGYKIGRENPDGRKWPEDVLRHSFGSYWLRLYHNKYELSEIMGNSPKVIGKHYKALVSESDAIKYWGILP